MISVLYVDDDPGLLEIGKDFLEHSGELLVDTTLSAADALQRIVANPYDAIVSDYQMPEIDGIDFLKLVRNSQGDLPFILFTGRGREEVVIEALNHGADSYLQKGGDPVPLFAELEHKIRQSVEQRQAQRRIRESEEQYRTLFEGANDAIFLMEHDHYIDCNKKALELFGCTRNKLARTSVADHSPEFQPDGEKSGAKSRALTDLAHNGEPGVFEWRHRRPDGTEFDVEVSLTRLKVHGRDLLLAILRDTSERRQMESALRESARLMTDIISFLPDATLVINSEGKVIAWNRSMEKLTGVPAADIIGKGNYEYALPFYGERRPLLADFILSPDESMQTRYPALSMKGQKLVSELFIQNLNGGNGAYLWFTASPLISTHGGVIGAIESIRDITDHKARETELMASYEQVAAMEEELRTNFGELAAREQALSASEAKFRTLFETMAEGSALSELIYDESGIPADFRILEVNAAFEKIFGIPRSHAVGKCSRDVFGRDEPSAFALYSRVATSRVPETVEVWSSWMKKHLSVSVYSPVKGAFATVFLDITERKESEFELRAAYEQITAIEEELRNNFEELAGQEQALRLSEERYRRIVETATEGIWELDEAFVTLAGNRHLSETLGYEPDEMKGRPFTEFLFEEDLADHVEKAVHRHDGISEAYERRFRHKSGKEVWCLVSATPVRDSTGMFKGSFAMMTDITMRKVAEHELRHKFDELNMVSEEMAAALEEVKSAEESLIVRNRELEEQRIALGRSESSLQVANKKLNLLASITRHDVINQLMILQGYIELSGRSADKDKISSFIEKERKVIGRIHHQILFTKEYQDIGVQAPLWQNVNAAVEKAIPGIDTTRIAIDPHVGSLEILADPLLPRVFYNLFDNVLRYGEGATRVTISAYPGKTGMIIAIEDDGIGIDPAEKARIFEKGYGKNTGLGLFLATEILHITNLSIKESGTSGTGAKFEIGVPEGFYRSV